ncbi:MAG: tetratricopeptide repeat protein [Acidaminococcaceae bacterium]|nr:tetratricopeptide repeat protein [Acidaminococcaceae bacterium]
MSGRYKEALPLQEQAFALQKEVLGEKHVIWDVTVNCSFVYSRRFFFGFYFL